MFLHFIVHKGARLVPALRRDDGGDAVVAAALVRSVPMDARPCCCCCMPYGAKCCDRVTAGETREALLEHERLGCDKGSTTSRLLYQRTLQFWRHGSVHIELWIESLSTIQLSARASRAAENGAWRPHSQRSSDGRFALATATAEFRPDTLQSVAVAFCYPISQFNHGLSSIQFSHLPR